jgi:hypothetical protein
MNNALDLLKNHASLAASVAAAIAAIASAFVAILAWRTSKQNLHSQMAPILRVAYSAGDEKLKLTNKGSGPALNVRLQKTRVHYVNMRRIIKYSFSSKQSRSIYNGDSRDFEIIANKLVEKDDLALVLKGLNLHRFIETIGKHRKVGIIYSDIHGDKFLLHFRFLEDEMRHYEAELVGISEYGVFKQFVDLIDCRMLVAKFPRELWYVLKEQIKRKNSED